MKAIAVNGSPRKHWNTATLLEAALDGAHSAGADTELVHLYDYDSKGCSSCFACKRPGTAFAGRCAMADSLSPVLQRAMDADVVILGTPIYLGNITGVMKSFIERLVFPCLSYDRPDKRNYDGVVNAGVVYTMGMAEERLEASGYPYLFKSIDTYLKLLNGETRHLCACDCLQFEDYSRYAASNFNEEAKKASRRDRFPGDCQAAFAMGQALVRADADRGPGAA